MQNVYIIGSGATPVGEHWERSAVSLAREALNAALRGLQSQGLERDQIERMYLASALGGAIAGQGNLAAAVSAACGMRGLEAHQIEAGGASGGVALRQAYTAIAGGMADIVAVVGVEKVSDVLDTQREAGLSLGMDVDWEAVQGATLTSQWALLMRRYMYEYGVDAQAFAPFPVNAHTNAMTNPQAMYRFNISAEKVATAAMVADPISLLDSSTTADGAAAVILASPAVARELGEPLIRIAGSAVATDSLALHSRRDPLWLSAVTRATRSVLKAANLEHRDVDVFDLSDQHGIVATLTLESGGFVERGHATHMAARCCTRPDGAFPLATAGGCKARGDTLGALGVYQIVELCRQLRGQAGQAQVLDARVAMAQCLAGIGSTAAAHVLVAE